MSTIEFNETLLGLRSKLLYFAMNLTSNREDAKDLLQETYLKAIANRYKFINPSNFKAWVFTIMKNIFINEYRRTKREKTSVDTTEDLYYMNLPKKTESDNPDVEYSMKEISASIEKLEDEFRLPFELHTQGYKYKEIADQLNIPIGTVKSRIFFSRKKLMDDLKDYN